VELLRWFNRHRDELLVMGRRVRAQAARWTWSNYRSLVIERYRSWSEMVDFVAEVAPERSKCLGIEPLGLCYVSLRCEWGLEATYPNDASGATIRSTFTSHAAQPAVAVGRRNGGKWSRA